MSRDRKRKDSDPKQLSARMSKAYAEGKPMDLEYDEVTGVIDVALQRSRAAVDAATKKAKETIAKLDAIPPAKVPT